MAVDRVWKSTKNKEASLWHKASLTVESAIVLPLFFLSAVVFAGMLDLYHTATTVQTALCEGAKELGMYAYCKPEDKNSPVGVVTESVCMAYGAKKVREVLKEEPLTGIAGGVNGITFLESGYEKELISLRAVFFYRIPVQFFKGLPVKIEIAGQARAWTGYDGTVYGSDEAEEKVYITEWESVYHMDSSCTYLSLSVREALRGQVEGLRNQYGEKYHACEKCKGDSGRENTVYITEAGSRYHSSASCSGLTRHVKLVKKSELARLKLCSRCKGD